MNSNAVDAKVAEALAEVSKLWELHNGKQQKSAKGAADHGLKAAPDIEPFQTFDAGDWEGIPIEPRRWIVHNRIPVGEPGIMSGDGGTGKTKLALQLGVSVGADLPDWIGGVVETHDRVLIYSAEEKLGEMQRRTGDILTHRGLSFKNIKDRLHFICDPEDVVLATGDEHKGTVTPTRSLLRLEKTVEKLKPALIIIENAADVYAGSEVNRSLVTRFVRGVLGGLAKANGATPLLIQHPSVSGLQDGSGRSGSTAWNNAGRWRLNFTKISDEEDSGLRQLHVIKSNYGPDGEKVQVRWDRGVFVPLGGASDLEKIAREAKVDDAFLRLLGRLTELGHDLGPHGTAKNYAPTIMAAHPENRGIRKKEFEAAVSRLLEGGRIHIESVGSPAKQRKYLRPGSRP